MEGYQKSTMVLCTKQVEKTRLSDKVEKKSDRVERKTGEKEVWEEVWREPGSDEFAVSS